ncbi:7-cyano-7-deazaguanine reductase [Gammaproteobacteria bacterium]|nr:7-cyano-7-deazaguanine reductase [Gammaproteobacteria bacterium]
MKPKFLGKKNATFKSPSENILDAIYREHSKEIFGEDIWNAYEFNFLSKSHQPILLPLEIRIPASSEKTVESKSLKLYLNSYSDFKSTQNIIIAKIKNDLSNITKSNVIVKVMVRKNYSVKPKSLRYVKEQKNNGNLLRFKGFRSLCPVTFQPDFATIYIQHKSEVTPSKEIIDHLLTYRTKGEFHERCIEDICSHLSLSFNLKSLTVIGRFMRRGGIDINPIRSLAKKYPKKNIHDTFQ